MSVINQKEYLKKYLNIGSDKEKKKKKKKKFLQNRVNIIDDNIDVVNSEAFTANELDEFLTQEDAPQVVGVIDDRPLALRLDDYRKNSKWKLVGSDDEEAISNLNIKTTEKKSIECLSDEDNRSLRRSVRINSDTDNSPPRKNYDNDTSNSYKCRDKGSSIKIEFSHKKSQVRGMSPVTINRKVDYEKKDLQKRKDISPRKYRESSYTRQEQHINKKIYRENSGSDTSPLRQKNLKDNKLYKRNSENSSSDKSPARRRNIEHHTLVRINKKYSDSDTSPTRRHKDQSSPLRTREQHKSSPGRHRKNSDSDASPPRKRKTPRSPLRRKPNYNSAPRRNQEQSPITRNKQTYDSYTSPPRSRKNCDSDVSPSCKNKLDELNQYKKESGLHTSPPKRHKDLSKDLKQNRFRTSPSTSKYTEHTRKSRWTDKTPPREDSSKYSEENSEHNERFHDTYDCKRENDSKNKKIAKENSPVINFSKKMEKTIDGKKAGLQNADDLKQETTAFKKREDELFKKMSQEISGINAAPIVRDRKTGRKRDFVKEAMDEFAKLKAAQEKKDKYDQWGKGLKQVDNLKEKVVSDLHEMNKPLARYADDEDLDKYLREQEREGDPMLAYIRKKKKKKIIEDGKPEKPMYQGEYMPNRFSIPPGYRWDGVDRSNGYEKEWFAKQNARKAMEEDIYKWSTEDM